MDLDLLWRKPINLLTNRTFLHIVFFYGDLDFFYNVEIWGVEKQILDQSNHMKHSETGLKAYKGSLCVPDVRKGFILHFFSTQGENRAFLFQIFAKHKKIRQKIVIFSAALKLVM